MGMGVLRHRARSALAAAAVVVISSGVTAPIAAADPEGNPQSSGSDPDTASQWQDGTGQANGEGTPPKHEYSRLDSVLRRLVAGNGQGQSPGGGGGIPDGDVVNPALLSEEETVLITVYSFDAVGDIVAWLREQGVLPRHVGVDFIEADVPVGLLAELSDVDGVARITETAKPIPVQQDWSSLPVGEGARVHGADTWHHAGITGEGVKIGIIDFGFADYEYLSKLGVIPQATVRCYADEDNSDSKGKVVRVVKPMMWQCNHSTHGTDTFESIYKIAPQAEYYLAHIESQGELLESVKWMIEEGVDIINHSIVWPFDGPGDGTSPVSNSPLNVIDTAVEAGILWTNAAGNESQEMWHGPFVPGEGDNSDLHNFGTASDPVYGLPSRTVFSLGETWLAYFRWEDNWAVDEDDVGAECDLDLELYRPDQDQVVAIADNEQSGDPGHVPLEEMQHKLTDIDDYEFRIRMRDCESPPSWMQLWPRPKLPISPTLLSSTHTIGNPAESANPGMLAVGAAPWDNPFMLEDFSNRGPTVGDGRVKPDIVAADCAPTSSSAREGIKGFCGTSQAAPHVAGLAALVMERYADDEGFDTPAEVAAFLKNQATQRVSPDPNSIWGHGFATLPNSFTRDYDTDDDGLIEVGSLGQLDAVRYDLDVDGTPDAHITAEQADVFRAAFGGAKPGMGCNEDEADPACVGYELTASLDFDSDGDGDVDAEDHDGAWWNDGAGWEPISDGLVSLIWPGSYQGVFEGNGHTVSNLHITNRVPVGAADDREPLQYFGLFGKFFGKGEVRNLNVTDVSISVESPAGRYNSDGFYNTDGYYAGGLVGENHGTITNVHVTGTVTADGSTDEAGGLAGRNTGTISYSSAAVTVTARDDAGGLIGSSYSPLANINRSFANGTVTSGRVAGGLVGTVSQVTITDSYAHGSATGVDAAGLVAVAWSGTIANSYATTVVSGTRDTGGLVADGASNTVTNSYWNSETTGQASSLGSPDTAAKTTVELRQDTEVLVDAPDYAGIYADWPKDIWHFGLNCHYPAIVPLTGGDGRQPIACASPDSPSDPSELVTPESAVEEDSAVSDESPSDLVERDEPQEVSDPQEVSEPKEVSDPQEVSESAVASHSGVVIGPDFCVNRSLGGATTYPFDSDGDGIADTCALPRTRRAAIARQQALEALAGLPPAAFDTLFAQQCQRVQETYGEPAQEATDDCAPHRGGSTGPTAPQPASTGPGPEFYSGGVTGPDFCVNLSLGGATTYPFDSNGDGIADTCSLPRTRRAAIARQQALEALAEDNVYLFDTLFARQCQQVRATYGEPAQEATDECAPHRSDVPESAGAGSGCGRRTTDECAPNWVNDTLT